MISNVLRNKVLDLNEKKITVEELEEWIVPHLPMFISDPDSGDADLAAAIELGLAELASDIRTYENFVGYLLRVMQDNTVVYTVYPTTTSSGSGQTQHTQQDLTTGQPSVQWIQL